MSATASELAFLSAALKAPRFKAVSGRLAERVRASGVAETVVDGVTGVLFDRPTVDALANAIQRLDGLALDPAAIRRRAEAFDTQVFRRSWRNLFARLGVDPSLYSRE